MFADWSTGASWILMIVLALGIEAATLNLNAVWFALGGLGGLLAATFGVPIPGQWVVFLIISAIFMVLVRPFAQKVLKPKGAATNADRILGEQAIVTKTINNAQAQGEIKIMGQYWAARSADGTVIEPNSLVRVREIVGVKAIVETMCESKTGG